ncbi:MAG: energy transducer TonB [Pyrinomonadaceae bacterium]|nr:energy transducer TonB [Pyrinomonadaceae bacterium]
MLKRISTSLLTISTALILFSLGSSNFAQSKVTTKANSFQPAAVPVESDRIKDGLVGPVRRVRTEIVKLASQDGIIVEGKRALLEVAAYDIKGHKVENQYYPIAGATLTGKEVYKYDDKGNISDMTLLNDDGSLMSKETYKYEFDFAGNWNKMTASVAVVEGGKFAFEPNEVTYRSIMYYLDDNMVKMAQPAAQPNGSQTPVSTSSPTVAKVNLEPKEEADSPANRLAEASQKLTPSLPPASKMPGNLDLSSNSAELRNVSVPPEISGPVVGLESEPPPGATAKSILKPVSGGVLNGMALFLPAPAYPDAAKRMRVAGTVMVEVMIGEDGRVISAEAKGGPVTLREVAVHAAQRARFSPTKLSGQPVKVSGSITYKFALTN